MTKVTSPISFLNNCLLNICAFVHYFLASIVQFLKFNKFYCIVTAFIILISFGMRIFWFSFGFDTEKMIYDYGGFLHQWITEQRYGLVLIKKVFFANGFNLYLETILAYITLFFTSVVLGVITKQVSGIKNGDKRLLIIPVLFLAHPIAAELFSFSLQSFECILGVLIVMLSVYMTYKRFDQKYLIVYLFISSLMLAFAFTIYQSLIPFSIAFFAYTALLDVNKLDIKKRFWKFTIVSFSIFIGSFILTRILPYIYSYVRIGTNALAHSTYLDSQIDWGKRDVINIILNIKNSVKQDILSYPLDVGNVYHSVLPILLLIIATSLIIKNRKNILEKITALATVYISPFMLTILLGHSPALRAEYPTSLFVSTAIAMFIFIEIKNTRYKVINFVLIIVIGFFGYWQIINTSNLFYLDYLKFRYEEKQTEQIINRINDLEIDDYTNYSLAVVGGKYKSPTNYIREYYKDTDMLLLSHFESDNGIGYYGTTQWLNRLFIVNGYNFKLIDQELNNELNLIYSHNMSTWPQKNSIVVDGEHRAVILKLGN